MGDFLAKGGPATRQDIVLATKFHGKMGRASTGKGTLVAGSFRSARPVCAG